MDLQGQGCQALCQALKRKDPATADHAGRVEKLAAKIASTLGVSSETQTVVVLAALLHDIGKISVESRILLKPGPLDDVETAVMRSHATIGGELVRDSVAWPETPVDVVSAIRHHHERWDGQGYPCGLAGDEIPLASRIIGVADAFDAMTSRRPYREPVSTEEALAELRREAGRQFDPAVVLAFLRTYDELIQARGAARVQPPYGMV